MRRRSTCRRRIRNVVVTVTVTSRKGQLVYCDVLSNSLTAKTEFPQSSLPVCVSQSYVYGYKKFDKNIVSNVAFRTRSI